MTYLEEKLVDYSLQDQSSKFLEKLTFWTNASELTKIISLKKIQTLIADCTLYNKPILAMKEPIGRLKKLTKTAESKTVRNLSDDFMFRDIFANFISNLRNVLQSQ